MANFEIHTIKANGEDLGVMTFENGELAVYQSEKVAKKVAKGMNQIPNIRRKYVVVETEA